jgi:transposase
MRVIAPQAPQAAGKSGRKRRGQAQPLTIAYPDACGIDIGASSHFVAVPPDRDDEPVREFAAFTADLSALVQWLRQCGITAVAMESTGVYWIPLYEMLDAAGFEVHLVNARHVKTVPGRKSDVLDCQWLQQLMSFGLLRGCFRPADEVCTLRAVWRHRDMLLSYQARHVQHLQKALTQMNVQLHHVITDLTRIPGIDTSTALKVLSEIGPDLQRFPSVKHFTSWLGLCPGTKISGGKVLSSATKRCANRAAQALRMAAQALRKSQSALGAYHRRLCARMDRPKAITATAHKLARLIYFMLTKGQDYVDAGQQYYEDRYRERVVQNLSKRAQTLGFQLIPADASA